MKRRRFLKLRKEEEQDFELNIAPIIDCFMVVITFLLVSASFISIGVIDTSAADAISAPQEANLGSVELAIDLKSNRTIAISITGDGNETFEIMPSLSTFDLNALGVKLSALKQKYSALNSANLNAESGVQYKDVIHALESVREQLPQVYLDPETEK